MRRICVRFGHDGFDPNGCHLHKFRDDMQIDYAEPESDFPIDDIVDAVHRACQIYGITFSSSIELQPIVRQPQLYQE